MMYSIMGGAAGAVRTHIEGVAPSLDIASGDDTAGSGAGSGREAERPAEITETRRQEYARLIEALEARRDRLARMVEELKQRLRTPG